jgi:hypothetical protein
MTVEIPQKSVPCIMCNNILQPRNFLDSVKVFYTEAGILYRGEDDRPGESVADSKGWQSIMKKRGH